MTVKELKEILNQLPEEVEDAPVLWERTNIYGLEVHTMDVYRPSDKNRANSWVCLFGKVVTI